MNAPQGRNDELKPAPTATGPSKVLVAEDDVIIAHLVEFKLQQQGYVVLSARNGETALDLAKSEHPTLIILDVMMPIINGFQVLEGVKRTPELKDIPVILLTANGRDADIERGLEMGAADYIVKPFSPNELMARVKKALREADSHR